MAVPRLILASASPRRVELLRAVGIDFEAIPSGIAEESDASEPQEVALRVARAKASSVARAVGDSRRVVLGADTIVVVDDTILGKPRDRDDAHAMLGMLSGREHTVITAYSLVRPHDMVLHEEAVHTRVQFRELSPREVQGYVQSGEVWDKAGAYAVQGLGMFLVREVHGSYTNVVGLPVCEVLEALERLGVARLFTPGGEA